jgi:hypothetical protein
MTGYLRMELSSIGEGLLYFDYIIDRIAILIECPMWGLNCYNSFELDIILETIISHGIMSHGCL